MIFETVYNFILRQYAKTIPKGKVIFVAGAVGKTTTAVVADAILSNRLKIALVTSEDDPTTILFKLTPNKDKAIIEIDAAGLDDEDFARILVPGTIVITRSTEEIERGLTRLMDKLPQDSTVIIDWDDPYTRRLAQNNTAQTMFYGTDPQNCHVWAGNLRLENFQSMFELNYGVERVSIKSKLLGFHQVYPMLAASALAISLNIPLLEIKKGLESLEAVGHRMQPLEGYNGSIILDDTYDSTLISATEAIETLNNLSARRRIVVLGEMRGLGAMLERCHRQIAQKVYRDKIDLVFTGGGDARFIADELKRLGFLEERMQANLTNSQIVSKLLKVLGKGDIVLIKGARSARLDEVVKRVARK